MMSRLFSVFIVLLILSSCARRGRPEGGPKDFDKPIMIKADPDFKSLQFEEDQIKPLIADLKNQAQDIVKMANQRMEEITRGSAEDKIAGHACGN